MCLIIIIVMKIKLKIDKKKLTNQIEELDRQKHLIDKRLLELMN